MTNWSYEFNFTTLGQGGGWGNWHYNNTPCDFALGWGWASGYQTDGYLDEQRISIRRYLDTPATITQIDVTYNGNFLDQSREVQNLVGWLYKAGTQVGSNQIVSLQNGDHTVTLDYQGGIICNQIDLMLQCEAGIVPRSGGATITSVVLHGTGTNPFILGTWCQVFDFAQSGDGGWVDFAYNGTHCGFALGWGWASGYQQGGNEDEQRISIRKILPTLASIDQLEVSYNGTFLDQVREEENIFGKLYAVGTLVGDPIIVGLQNGSHVVTLTYESATCNQIDLMMQCEAGYVPRQGGATITKVVIRGTGANPFTLDETNHQNTLDTKFAAIRTALQTNPSADVSAAVGEYKTAIQNAFGVTFDKEITSPPVAEDWGVVSLYFAHQAFQETAERFEQWVESELDNECIPVDRYALFRRVTNGLILKNLATEASNVALTTGNTINIYRVPGGNRQWKMTPNNLIHELGHFLSRSSGFSFSLLGSIENELAPFLADYAIDTRYDRDGMGPLFLRQQIDPGDFSTLFYVHATIDPDGIDPNLAVFDPQNNDPVTPPDYLFYTLFGQNYNLWNSPYNIYPKSGTKPTARVDLFVQNYPLLPGAEPRTSDDIGFDFTRRGEITADSFLNWVRESFDGTKGSAWLNFYEAEDVDNHRRIGMFLRNAVIYNYSGGMVQFYKDRGVIPQLSLTIGTVDDDDANVRLTPTTTDNNIVAVTANVLNLNSVPIYGWSDTNPSGSSPYWLLVEDSVSRLVWVASNAIDYDDTKITPQNEIDDIEVLSPVRPYNDTDFSIILGA